MEYQFSPMSETSYCILLSLVEERHGYGIMQHVSDLTKGRINLGAGTIYGTLSKLENAKLIAMSKEEDKRKYYKITEQGLDVLKAEVNRIAELYKIGEEVLLNERE